MHYLSIARRRIWIVVAFTVLVAVIATLVALSKPSRYEATSTVLINRQSLANQIAGGADVGLQQQSFQQVLTTQAKLARTPQVLRAAIEKSGSDIGFDGFKSASAVTANRDSDLLDFNVTQPDAEEAKRLSVAYAEAYVSYRRSLDTAALESAIDDVDRAIGAARRGGRQNQLVQRLTTSRQELETRMALQTSNVQVVAEPENAVKVQPRPVRSAAMGLLAGFVVGVLAAAGRHALDTRIRSSAEVESTLQLPTLARIGSPTEPRDGEGGIVMLTSPREPGAEPFRLLRTNVNYGIQSYEARVVMVSSATQGEGKSTTIANLAVAFAAAGKSVALLDLDLRRPTVARLFDLTTAAGATTVALGDSTFEEALVEVGLPDYGQNQAGSAGSLHVLTSGPLPPDPSEFLGSERMRSVIAQLRGEFDLILVDAPPLVAVSDTQIIAEMVDAVFVCVRLGVVHRPLLAELRRSLDRVSVPVLGQVVTGADDDDDFNYYSSYGYTYGPTVSPTVAAPVNPTAS